MILFCLRGEISGEREVEFESCRMYLSGEVKRLDKNYQGIDDEFGGYGGWELEVVQVRLGSLGN